MQQTAQKMGNSRTQTFIKDICLNSNTHDKLIQFLYFGRTKFPKEKFSIVDALANPH